MPVDAQDEYCIVSSTCMYFDDKIAREAELKRQMQKKAFDYLDTFRPNNRPVHYNRACTHAKFRQYEEAAKWLKWTFNFHDGLYTRDWFSVFSPPTKDLYEAMATDSYFDEVREFDWYKHAMKIAEDQIKIESDTEARKAFLLALRNGNNNDPGNQRADGAQH